jgi:hypothetical protein
MSITVVQRWPVTVRSMSALRHRHQITMPRRSTIAPMIQPHGRRLRLAGPFSTTNGTCIMPARGAPHRPQLLALADCAV